MELGYENLIQPRLIIEYCSGVVVIAQKSSTVRLVHHTLQDFLQARRQNLFPTTDTHIATTCLTYLCFWDGGSSQLVREVGLLEDGQREWQSLHDCPLLGYASIH